ncbi:MAG: ImmA/IrrE family metallo-endopeptidase [Alphaproteobacteria bacterium]|nr:ImmA/IrrE family metallo-endopeptidase [Alphaproteobacteria bacterium]
MTIDVDYLSPQAIESEANALLASFEAKHGKILSLETPLDEIVEFHLGLTCEMADLGHEAILGQIDIEDKIIRINENLDTSAYPNKEGRFNYTLGHEAGHWVLHRSYVEKEITESLFEEKKEKIILCRQQEQKARVEVQADMFASFLLMPARKVFDQFVEETGRPNGLDINAFVWGMRQERNFMDREFPSPFYIPSDEDILLHAFADLAKRFKVSRQAMVYRLKTLGLLSDAKQGMLAF